MSVGEARRASRSNSKQNDNNEAKDSANQQDSCNVYIAGIPRRATEDTLRKVFSKFGSIKNVHIIKDH